MSGTVDLDTQLGPFRVYAEGTITRALQEGQWWDDHLLPALSSVARGGAAVDIGAHFGWFTRYFALRHRQVFAIEPWPESFRLLQHNVALTSPTVQLGVQCWPVAAYHCAARLTFAARNDLSDAGSFGFNPHDRDAAAVLGVPLDMYLPQAVHVGVVKCDAQGADLQALQGMRQTLQRCQPLVVFEWEEGLAQDQRTTWEDYLRFFHEIGYTAPERITQDYWDFVVRPKERA